MLNSTEIRRWEEFIYDNGMNPDYPSIESTQLFPAESIKKDREH